jgi:DNA-binding beta-propeller fold protein YncE
MTMRLGDGSHVYEIVEGWAKLPKSASFGITRGVVVDPQDCVYVLNQSKDTVIVFDRDGNFIKSWGEEFAEGADGFSLSREASTAYLYIPDHRRHMVAKASLDGDIVWTLGVPNLPDVYKNKDLYKPTGVAVAPNGDLYVCDGRGQNWIHHYNAGGELIRSWGGSGSEPGMLNNPTGVWLDTRRPLSVLLVADRGNLRIQVFTLTGKHVGFITEGMRCPSSFYQSGDELYVADLHGRVTILDKLNKLITHLGDNPNIWERPGWPNLPAGERPLDKFISPCAVCVDSHRDLYVVEWISDGRLTKLRRCD